MDCRNGSFGVAVGGAVGVLMVEVVVVVVSLLGIGVGATEVDDVDGAAGLATGM